MESNHNARPNEQPRRCSQWQCSHLVCTYPPLLVNANIKHYTHSYNDVHAITQSNLQFRASSSVNAGGLYLSTFFGGNDNTWSAPSTTHSYFRNFRLWGSSAPSNLTGSTVSAGGRVHGGVTGWSWVMGGVGILLGLGFA